MSLFSRRLVAFALSVVPLPLLAADSQESLAREYEQVRRIALRDPKVRAAYAAAEQRLDEKIVKIDPSLAAYVKSRRNPNAAKTTAEQPSPAPRKSASRPQKERSHVVANGDTLSSIAAKYAVSVSDIRRRNHIQDERRLPIGQTLTIPPAR